MFHIFALPCFYEVVTATDVKQMLVHYSTTVSFSLQITASVYFYEELLFVPGFIKYELGCLDFCRGIFWTIRLFSL